jgi:competence protein ComEC
MRGRRPLLPLTLGFAVGVSLAPGTLLRVASAVAAPLLALSPPLAPLGLFCAAVAASRSPLPIAAPPSEVVIEGRVASVPERRDDRVRFLLRDADARLLDLAAPEPAWPLAWGDRVRAAVELRSVPGARNPGGRDRAARSRACGIDLEGSTRQPPVRIASPSLLAGLEAARIRFAHAAEGAMPRREAALVRAIGSGDTSAIDPATQDAFARSGLAHILSVSGLHLAVVAFGLFRLLGWLLNRWDAVALRIDPRRWAAGLALPATVLYALATGAQVPIVRSAIASGAAFLGVILDREGDALNTLSLAALAILAVEPGALLDPSFQLSFASVAGLSLLTGPMRRALPIARAEGIRGRLREAALSAVCASLAATIATAPIVALHFRRISLLAVAANLLGVPLGSGLTILATLAALASAVGGPLGTPLLWLCRPAAFLLLTVNDLFAAPRWAALGVSSPGLAGVAACYVLLAIALRARGGVRLLAVAASLAALLLPGPMRYLAARQRGGLEVVFLAVGQGDAAVLRLPDASGVLIDSGGDASGRYDPGARDVLPFLRDMGIRRLAAVFVSHPHSDHLLGLPAVAESLTIERLFGNGRAGDEVAQAAWARLPPARALGAGASLELAGTRFEVLAPPPGDNSLGENDASLVLRITYGETVLLFAGDLEAEGEAALLATGRPLHADVLKVPHHGSQGAFAST